MKLKVEPKALDILDGKGVQLVTIPANSVTEVSYDQDVHRRIGTLAAEPNEWENEVLIVRVQ